MGSTDLCLAANETSSSSGESNTTTLGKKKPEDDDLGCLGGFSCVCAFSCVPEASDALEEISERLGATRGGAKDSSCMSMLLVSHDSNEEDDLMPLLLLLESAVKTKHCQIDRLERSATQMQTKNRVVFSSEFVDRSILQEDSTLHSKLVMVYPAS